MNVPVAATSVAGTPERYTSRIFAWSGRQPSSGHASHAGTPMGGSAKLELVQLSDTAVRTNAGPVKSEYCVVGSVTVRCVPPGTDALPFVGPERLGPPSAVETLPRGTRQGPVPR